MKRNATILLAILLALVIGLLLGPCVITSNPSIPAADPEAADDTSPADPDSTGAQ